MFSKHLMIQTDDKETAVIMAIHPKVVKEILLDCTASFDYQFKVSVDGKELKWLNPNVYYDGYQVSFYFQDTAEIVVGSRVEITLVFWYKDKIVRELYGSVNMRRDETSQATEHWTYMPYEQFAMDPEDVDCSGFLEMLDPEWRFIGRYAKIEESNDTDENIIDVEYTEVEKEETNNGYGQKRIECGDV